MLFDGINYQPTRRNEKYKYAVNDFTDIAKQMGT